MRAGGALPGPSRRRASLAALSILGAALAAASCRGALGTDGYGIRHEAVGACDGVTYDDVVCRDCVDASCCDVAAACAAEPACAAMTACLGGCRPGDSACRGLCHVSIPGTSELAAVVACEAAACDVCAASRAVRGPSRCDACVASRCSLQLEAVSRSEPALALAQCRRDCPAEAPGCTCADVGGAETTFAALVSCEEGPCRDDCAAVTDWSCVGHVQWPPPPPSVDELTLHVAVVRPDNPGQLLTTFDVRACTEIGADCDAPIDTARPGADGWATLALPALPLGQPGFFGRLETESPELGATALMYFFPPVRVKEAWSLRRAVPKSLADATTAAVYGPVHWDRFGGVAWSTTACSGPGAGVSATIDSGQRAYYYGTAGNIDVGAEATSSVGFGVFIEVPPGQRTVEARVAATGELVGRYAVWVRVGAITHLTVAPQPRDD